MQTPKFSMRNVFFWSVICVFLLIQYFFIGDMMRIAEKASPLVFELFAAVMGSIVTVAAMALMMKAQSQQDKEKEFAARIFEKKLELYQELLNTIFKLDDDDLIEKQEVQEVENQIGVACLVANVDLVSLFAQYLYQLKIYGVLYFRSMTPRQLDNFREFAIKEKKKSLVNSKLANAKHLIKAPIEGNEVDYFVSLDEFIQGIRDDLAIVEGNVTYDVEHFVRTPIDKYNLFKNPNNVG